MERDNLWGRGVGGMGKKIQSRRDIQSIERRKELSKRKEEINL